VLNITPESSLIYFRKKSITPFDQTTYKQANKFLSSSLIGVADFSAHSKTFAVVVVIFMLFLVLLIENRNLNYSLNIFL
jgi:hypothetical protein